MIAREMSANELRHKRSRVRESANIQNKTFVEPKHLEKKVYMDPLLQGQKHEDNPWIQKVSKKEEQNAKRFSKKIITVRKKTTEVQEGLKESDKESEIIAEEFNLEIFKELSKKEYRQLISYDTWENDFPPEVWVEKCKASDKEAHGVSPMFNGKTYTWEPVKVLGYNTVLKKFRIMIIASGQVKEVTRLSLMFYKEDREQFLARLKECRERRENVESELRFQHFVDSLPATSVLHIPAHMVENILQRSTLKESKKYVDETVEKLTKIIDAVYRRSIKKCLVLQNTLDKDGIQKLEEFNVPIKFNEKAPSYIGVIDVGRGKRRKVNEFWITAEAEYLKSNEDQKMLAKNLSRLERKAGRLNDLKLKRKERKITYIKEYEKDLQKFGNAAKLILNFTGDFQKICEDFKKRRLFQTVMERLQLPMRCSQFMNIQDKRIHTTITDALNNWRFQILYNMRNKVGEKFVFDVAEKQKYEESLIRKLIHKFDLLFHHHLEEFYLFSIKEFVEFMRSFTHPEGSYMWKISSVPLIEIDIRYTGSDKKKESKKDEDKNDRKHKHKKDDKKKKEEKSKEQRVLMFKPDINQCKTDLLSLLTKVVESTKKISILETEDFNVFLTDKKDSAFELTPDSPVIVRAREAVTSYIDLCSIGPNELLNKFKKYEFLMVADTSSIKKIMDKENPPSAAELKQQLDKLSKANYEVQTLATDLVRFSMFQINTEMVKKYLAQRAQKLKLVLLQAISKHCQKSVADILNSYKQLLSKLEDKPTSKDAYKELKMYLKNSNKRMDELKGQHELVRLKLELLEDNLVKVDKDDERNFWDVHQYPSKLRSKIAKGNNNLINYEEQIRIELENQKDQFDKEMNICQTLFDQIINFTDTESARKEYRSAFELHDKIEKAIIKAREINDDEGLLEMKRTEYNTLDKLSKSFQPFYSLIKFSEEIQMTIEGWKTNPFIGLNPIEIEAEINSWNTALDDIDNQLVDYKDQADVALQLKEIVANFATHLELIKCLRSEAMKEEEFNEINKQIPLDLKMNDDTYSLNTLIKKNAEDYMEQIRETWEKAERKLDLEKSLKHIKDDMHKKRIELVKYSNTDTYIIQSYKQIMDYVDDQITKTQAMLNSPYMVGALRKNCMTWTAKFGLVSEILEELKKCQQTWMYLEPIFSAEDIRLTLKREAERFMDVNIKLKQQMDNINADNLVISLLDKERLKEDFVRANFDLDAILRHLSDYFEAKRRKFSRFYFMSDEDLIRMLSHAKQDLSSVEPHLSKCFNKMGSIVISESKSEIVSVVSFAREKIDLIRPLDIMEGDKRGNIEIWLGELEKILFETMEDLSKKGIIDYANGSLEEFIAKWPSLVVLLAIQVHLTSEINRALRNQKDRKSELKEIENKLDTRINKYVEMIRKDLSQLQCLLIEALLVLDIHGKAMVQDLLNKDVSEKEFGWLVQMRHTFVDNRVRINTLAYSQVYGYEYNGNPSRLVMTPLTDRCFRTLIMAKQMNKGGVLMGPAGSGKTEIIKDLAKVLGVYYVVFNGSDALDQLALAKFFKGLSMSGAWCCFDEFNKIPSDVLSILASQIFVIQEALSMKATIFHFMEEEIVLNPKCGINVTMNMSLDFMRNLPNNLKTLFRPCAVTMPENELIIEVLLYSYGFQTPKELSKKIIELFKLCQEQLSDCNHYSYGIRNIKEVLIMAKKFKKEMLNESENAIIKKALDEISISKLNANDLILYEGIVGDLFPGVVAEPTNYKDLNTNLLNTLHKEHLQAKPEFLKKCIELYDCLKGIHGIIIVGESLSGKTTMIHTLRKALCDESRRIEFQSLNPKAVTLSQLFGYFDESYSWKDGILSKTLRDFCECEDCEKWFVCDGPIDTEWTESVSTTLDDTRKLCLSSGTAISLDPGVRMFFEVENLRYASPGITSRCSVVYMERANLEWEILVKSYCEQLPASLAGKRLKTIEEFMPALIVPTMAFMNRWCKFQIEMNSMHLVKNFLNIFECFMCEFREEGAKLPSDLDNSLPNMLIFAIIWGFGGSLEESLKGKFKEFLLDLLNITDVRIKYKLDVDVVPIKLAAKLPESQDLFKIVYDSVEKKWLPWTVTETLASVPITTPFHELMVSTDESVRIKFLVQFLASNHKHTLLLGPSGSGKTINIQHTLKTDFTNAKFAHFAVSLSAKTTANQLQQMMECRLEKRGRKTYYGPLHSKQGIVFLDDLNLPQKDTYGTQPTIELLRQWMDHGGWYDVTTDLGFKYVIDITFVAAITPSAADRANINLRYIRHYNVIVVDSYERTQLIKIFSEILNWKFKEGYASELKDFIPKIAKVAVDICLDMHKIEKLRPIPSKPHYAFNLKDSTKVLEGMMLATAPSLRSTEDFMKLWSHETLRVFCDRLTTQEDREAFALVLQDSTTSHFDKEWEEISGGKPLMFCDFLPSPQTDPEKPAESYYREVADTSTLKAIAESYLAKYKETDKPKLNIVLFGAAIEHIVQLKRVFSIPSAHALLLGMGSSGRKSLASLAAFIGGLEVLQVTELKRHEVQEWQEKLRKLVSMTGVEKTSTVFLISDDQVNNDFMMADIHSLLSTGEVPNLYSKTSRKGKDDFMTKLKENMQSRYKKIFNNDEEIIELLKVNSKEKLHIAFCMNPIGNQFRQHLRAFPSLMNYMTINYFLPWPEEGLKSVASQFLDKTEGFDVSQEGTISSFVDFQESARALAEKYANDGCGYYYVTPASYLEFLKVFKALFQEKYKEIVTGIQAYENGLEELRKTEQFVAQMKVKLQDLEPELNKKSESTAQLTDSLKRKQSEVAEETKIVQKDQEMAEESKKVADELQAECQADLDIALPELKETEKQIGEIKQEAIANLAAMGSPPDEVKLVAKALCIILDIKPKKIPNSSEYDYWIPKKIFTFKNIKWCSVDFNKENIPLAKITELRKINDNPSFAPEKLKSVSEPGEMLARWIRAILKFDQVNREVAPKKAKLKEESDKAKAAHDAWTNKSKQLEEKRALLNELTKEAKSAEEQKKRLAQEIDLTRKKIERARELLDLLKNENKRWTDQRNILQVWNKSLAGNILISSGIISYLGIFSPSYRDMCIKTWSESLDKLQIEYSENFGLFGILGDPLRKLSSTRVHFPADSASSDNVIIMERATRWPLIIDPQLQVTDWVKSKPGIATIKANQGIESVLKHLTVCMSSGIPALLEGVEEDIDSRLNPLLKKDIITKGQQTFVQMNGDLIKTSKMFKFYMSTTIAKPHYSPEICSLLTILNFTVTEEGLIEQALNMIVRKEDPNTEKNRDDIVNKSLESKKKLKTREEELLKIVTTHREGILESDKLLENLKTTKAECQHSIMQVEEQKRLSERIEATRMKFKKVAMYVAKLYFCVTDLAMIGPMYQYSLDWYINLYNKALQTECVSEDTDKLEFYKNAFIELLFASVCRSLFQRDRLIFVLSLYFHIALSEEKITLEEIRFLSEKPVETTLTNVLSSWMSDEVWKRLCNLGERFEAFKDIDKELIERTDKWKALNDLPNLSNPLLERFSPYQKFLIVSMMRPDKFTEIAKQLIEITLGKQYCEYRPCNLEEALELSTHKKPILIILSRDGNIMEDIKALSKYKNTEHGIIPFSLGKSQMKTALSAIDRAVNKHEPTWIVLQNCHLATAYLNLIEKALDDIHSEPKLDCRVWFTTSPCKNFPISLLQKTIKIINEKPTGVAQNMAHSFKEIEQLFSEPGLQLEVRRKLLFGLCFFHSVVAERAKFGTLAWNSSYTFYQTDLILSARQITELLKGSDETSWEAINHIIIESNYGGKINDSMDLRLIRVMTNNFLGPDVLLDQYKFSGLKEYYIPKAIKSKDECMKFIMNLPQNDKPELFGLSEAAAITYSLNDGAEIRSILTELMSGSKKCLSKLQENELSEKVKTMIREVPQELDKAACIKRYPISYDECLNSILQQEISQYINLLNVVRNSLQNLDSALHGELIMSKDLDEILNSVNHNEVPLLWQSFAYPSLKSLASWLKDLGERVQFLENWIKEGHLSSYKLSVFFRPQCFLRALLQNHARRNKLKSDEVVFEYEVTREKRPMGKAIDNLYIEGAMWDQTRQNLAELNTGMIFEPMPPIVFTPISIAKKKQSKVFLLINHLGI